MRRFPALSYSGSESDSSALFSDRIEEVVLEEAEEVLEEVVVGVQCGLGEGRACVLWWTGSEKVREQPTWV